MCGAESWLKGKGRCLPFWSNNDKKQCHGNETEATQPASISESNTLKALPPRLPEAGWDLPCPALSCLLCFPQGRVAEQGAPGLNNACGTTYAFCRTRDLCKAGFPAGAAGACCSLSGPAACHLLWEQAAESTHRDGVSKSKPACCDKKLNGTEDGTCILGQTESQLLPLEQSSMARCLLQ